MAASPNLHSCCGRLARVSGPCQWRSVLARLAARCSLHRSGPARDGLLQAIVAGEALVGLAAMNADEATPTVAARVGDHFHISGRKNFLLQGAAWTHLLVSAECPAEGDIGLFLVDQSAPGLTLRCYTAVDGRSAADASFDGVKAVRIAQGPQALAAARSRGQLLAAAEEAGIARAAWEQAKRHLADRAQFGQPLLQFQAIRHRLVEAHICIRELECLLDHVRCAFDTRHPDCGKLLLQLRAQASSTATRITRLAIQLHGGMGMTTAMPLGDYYKRAMLLGNQFGTSQAALDQLSGTLPLDLNPPRATTRKQQGIEHAD